MGEINYTMSFCFKGFFHAGIFYFFPFENFHLLLQFGMIVFCVIAGNGKSSYFKNC